MLWDEGKLRFSPSDLTVFLDSEFASWMDRWHGHHEGGNGNGHAGVTGPFVGVQGCTCARDEADEGFLLLARKGSEHELAVFQTLKADGFEPVHIPRTPDAFALTLAAMQQGARIVYQACLRIDGWGGYADFLAKRDGGSGLGGYHYEVWDTKLARSPKPSFLVQLCAYAEMLEHLQGRRPSEVEIVLGNGERRRFPTNQFFFYFRELKRAFARFHEAFDRKSPPHPGASGSFGKWTNYAEQILAAADHPSCVARMTRSQIKKLHAAGITTMSGLATTGLGHVAALPSDVLHRLKTQAKLQIESRGKECPAYQVVPPAADDPRRGLALLPPASPSDVFFDIEGYPLAEGGLEYLLGAAHVGENGKLLFRDWWAHNPVEEKKAFEGFIDWAHGRWTADRGMHIYHYAAYEVMAVRRLMGTYATREQQVDDLLRHHVFVDLYTVVRQGLVVGTPSYSLKDVERLYSPKRSGGVTTAGGSVVAYQRWLDHADGETWRQSAILKEIRDYNEVDCVSLVKLCAWLRQRQEEAKIAYLTEPGTKPEAESVDGEAKPPRQAAELSKKLLAQIEAGGITDDETRRVQELLAWLLEFHRREAKPVWWRMFDRHGMTEQELVDDPDCIGGLRRTSKPRVQVKKSWEYEYRFDPDQDTKLHEGSKCYFAHDLDVKCEIITFDPERGLLGIKLGPKAAEPPSALCLIPDEYVSADSIAQAVYRYVAGWSEGRTLSRAVDDLLHRRPPRITGHAGGMLLPQGAGLEGVVRLATRLDESTLCIQGPPGTGKTFTAAAVIVELVRHGKSVGITATSHKCILNAMHAVAQRLDAQKVSGSLLKVGDDPDDPLVRNGTIKNIESKAAADYLGSGPIVLGGTAWLFSRDDLVNQLDYLVIDEAGQFCLANVVATGQAARNIILVGDQMQLSQPTQGSHPGDSGMSGLEYLLQRKATVPPDFGIFLNTTWRMHPHICQFISAAVYEGRLASVPETARQEVRCLDGRGGFARTSGVVFVEVPHDLNSQCSDEEVEAIERIVSQLMGRCVVGRDGGTHDLTLDDVLIVAPYNMQVRRLQARLGPTARVGSVDRFQGQEAAVVIVSMCASSVEECPRGVEFVLNKNRINVAVSRAKCLAIVVGSRTLMSTRCQTIEQMEMTNLYCWLAAHAEQPPAAVV